MLAPGTGWQGKGSTVVVDGQHQGRSLDLRENLLGRLCATSDGPAYDRIAVGAPGTNWMQGQNVGSVWVLSYAAGPSSAATKSGLFEWRSRPQARAGAIPRAQTGNEPEPEPEPLPQPSDVGPSLLAPLTPPPSPEPHRPLHPGSKLTATGSIIHELHDLGALCARVCGPGQGEL